MTRTIEWSIHNYFVQGGASQDVCDQRALLILNQPLCGLVHLRNLWHNVSVRMCADGGANRLYDTLGTDELRQQFLPNVIRGDLDSLRDDVRRYYESQGVKIEHEPDQYSTDFHKCLSYLEARHESNSTQPPRDLIVLGALSGRLDQTIQSLATLYKLDARRKTVLFSNDSAAMLLRACAEDGEPLLHRITCVKGFEGPTCGIGSLGGDARAVTTGLKWNLDESMVLNFDKLWSSSNTFAQDASRHVPSVVSLDPIDRMLVTVKTDVSVLWTVEVDLA